MNNFWNILWELKTFAQTGEHLPSFFIGHGSPMNAVEENEITKNWKQIWESLENMPKAILCISAHWITRWETLVHISKAPKQIYDFYWFPQYLYEKEYRPEWSPKFARETIDLVKKVHIGEDEDWGIDHGTWSILAQMFPEADIPVYQLSIDYDKPFSWHFALGKELMELRTRGVLIVGSGNLVHNLWQMMYGGQPYDWNIEFDSVLTKQILERDFGAILNKKWVEQTFSLAHPTHDHYLPLLYFLWTISKQENIETFNEAFDLSSISMKSFVSY